MRVGCYFHDIGKIAKPGYYIENQMGAENPHDKLAPDVSGELYPALRGSNTAMRRR